MIKKTTIILMNLLLVSNLAMGAGEQPYEFGFGQFKIRTDIPIVARSKYLDSQNTQLLINQCFNAINQCKSSDSDKELIELLKQENGRLRAELEGLK